jgi:hypothetical protein
MPHLSLHTTGFPVKSFKKGFGFTGTSDIVLGLETSVLKFDPLSVPRWPPKRGTS